MRKIFLGALMTMTLGCSGAEEIWVNELEVIPGFQTLMPVVEKSRTIPRAGERGSETLERSLLAVPIPGQSAEEFRYNCRTVEECDHFPRNYALVNETGKIRLRILENRGGLSGVVAIDGEPQILGGDYSICFHDQDSAMHPLEGLGAVFKIVPIDEQMHHRRVFTLTNSPSDGCQSLRFAVEALSEGDLRPTLLDVVTAEDGMIALFGVAQSTSASRFHDLMVVDLSDNSIVRVGDHFRGSPGERITRGVRFGTVEPRTLIGNLKLNQQDRAIEYSVVDLTGSTPVGGREKIKLPVW